MQMEPAMQTSQTFTFHRDPDYGFIVADASVTARSFAMVPADREWSFEYELEARKAAIEYSRLGQPIPTRMIQTPDRFEAVADTRYGAAW